MIGVGDKVVCVDDVLGLRHNGAPSHYDAPNGRPKKGEIFVVEGFFFPTWHNKYFGLQLIGKPCIAPDGTNVGFVNFKFRKLSDHRNEAELSYRRLQQQPALQPQHE